jgi:DNA (cytosine-5)-methyltransferase 1
MPEKNRFPAVLQPIVIDRAAFNAGENAQYVPHIEETELMDTVVARGPHAVLPPSVCATGDITHCLTKSYHSSEDGTGRGLPIVPTAMSVRRLTNIECERLQGFPDNWSQIPWKGKPAEECPDGPRYKCAGNSMAVPVMRWVGEQIARVESQKI